MSLLKIKAKALLIGLSLSAVVTQAQPWMASMKSTQPSFREQQTAFTQYWENKPYEKGQGYKAFKRWEWYWQSRLLPDGSFPSPSINRDELVKYRKKHPTPRTAKVQAANWSFQGPSTSAGGYFGLGRLNTIAFHPTDVNTFWVGAPAGGLWKTTDGGATWSSNTDNLGVLGVSGIAINPQNPNIMYIATGDGDGADTYSMGILKSVDGGETWQPTALKWTPTNTALLRRLVINPTNPQILLAAANGILLRTADGGNSWQTVKTGQFYDVEFHPADPNIVYAAANDNASPTTGRIFTSTNGGLTWTETATLTSVRRIKLAVTPAAPNVVQALCTNEAWGLAGVWTSTDNGNTFSRTFTGSATKNLLHLSSNASGTGGQGHYDLAFAINPTNANELWIGGINSWRSEDGGLTWTLKNYWNSTPSAPTVHADKHFLAFHPLNPTTLFECNDGGLYKTTNGGTSWTNLSNGLGISQIYRIGVSATTPDLVIAGLQDNSSKKKQGTMWTETAATGDGFESIIDYNNANVMYTSSYYGSIQKSTNGGASWSPFVGDGGTSVNERGPWLTPYIMHPTNSNTLLVGKKQVYQTIDGGTTWTQLGTLPVPTESMVSAMAYAPSDPQTIYVATNSYSGLRLSKTTDGGKTWKVIRSPSQWIQGLAVHPYDPQKIWFTQGGYTAGDKVWYSANGGDNWTNISGTLPNVPANCIVYQNGTKDGLYLGTDVGVFYLDGDETDWQAFQTGLPNVVVTELEIAYADKKLWAATYGRGLWSTDIVMAAPCTTPEAPTSSGDVTGCLNATPVTLTVTPPVGTTVDWYSNSTGGSPIAIGSNSFKVTTAGVYYAESRNTVAGCKSATRTAVALTLSAAPATPDVTPSASTTFCQGGSVTLTSSAATDNQWFKDGVAITGATNTSYVADASGVYTVKVMAGTCASNASANTTVTVNTAPAQPTISQNGGVLRSSVATGNQWYFNGTAITLNATGQTYTPTASGQYTVVATQNGCASPASAPLDYTITSVNSPELDNQLLIAPNPVSHNLTVTYKGNPARFQVMLLDLTGKQVLAQGTFTSSYTLNMQGFSAGPYIIRITNERSKEHVQRVIMKK